MYGAPTCHENREAGLTESWEYSPQGLLTSAIGGGMRYEYAYYTNGSLKEKRASGRTLLPYTYDADDRRTSQRDLTGRVTQYQYTPANSYPGSWRMAGNRTERIRGAVLEQYLYDECNRLLQITDGADTVKNYTYDNSGNMLSDGEIFLSSLDKGSLGCVY